MKNHRLLELAGMLNEDALFEADSNAASLYNAALKSGKRASASQEAIIAKDPVAAYKYAKNVLKAPWPAAEKTINMDARTAALYKRDVLREGVELLEDDLEIVHSALLIYDNALKSGKRASARGEAVMMQDPYVAYMYARDVLKAPWPAAEKSINTDSRAFALYKKNVLREEAEVTRKQKILKDIG